MLEGVNLYVDEVNKSGGINDRTLEVIAYDDQNNKVMARNKALEIAKDSNTLVVIGHYYSSISLEGGRIYKEYGIPAVTASATAPEVTEGNDWYFRVDINEISNINPRTETFTADFYLWFRHKGYLDYSKIEFLNAVKDLRLRDEPIIEMTDQNIAYRAYRYRNRTFRSFILVFPT